MFQLKNVLNMYGSKIKYFLLFVGIFVMILAIRTYINYITIIDTTNTVNRRSALVQNELDYSQNFQSKYLASEYGHLFLAHDNNSIFWGESIISFKNQAAESETIATMSLNHIPDRREVMEQEKINLTPQQARQQFIKEKIQ